MVAIRFTGDELWNRIQRAVDNVRKRLDRTVRALDAFRDKDRTHLRDMLELGLIDESWYGKLPEDLGYRLKVLIDTPDQ